MREDLLSNVSYSSYPSRDRYPKVPVCDKPEKCDKTQDTTLDPESWKVVPCTCRLYDSTESIPTLADPAYGVSGPECRCLQQKGKTLLDAVFTGNSELLEICLDQNADLNARDERGETVLHMVSDRGDVEMLQFLLKLNAIDINVQNEQGLTPLSVAIMSDHDDSAKILLEHGADPNITDNNGKTPIAFSVNHGNAEMTQLLIEYGADTNTMDTFGNTPLATALVERPMLQMVQVLLSNGANPLIQNNRLNPFLETVLACTNEERFVLVRTLVENGVNINATDPVSRRNCLHLTGINGYMPLAVYLVNCGADLEKLDVSGRRPDEVALEQNNLDVADYFLKSLAIRRIIYKQRLLRSRKLN